MSSGRAASTSRGGKALVERERPRAANSHHADDAVVTQPDYIRVLGVKTIDEEAVRRRCVPRDLLNECLVVECVNLFELERLGRELDAQ
jgi:hypothetical protein